MKRTALALALTLAVVAGNSPAAGQARPSAQPPDGVTVLLGKLEAVLQGGQPAAFLDLLSLTADRRRASDFATATIVPGVTRVALRERDRLPLEGTLPGNGYQLMVEALIESGGRARLATWSVDVRRRGDSATGEDWGIAGVAQVTGLTGLYRLALNPLKQYTARDFAIASEDLRLTFDGSVFVAEAEGGPTALVLVGRGEMTFSPTPETERGQIRLVAGADALKTPFDSAFIRVSPFGLASHFDMSKLVERPVDPRELRRAEDIFKQDVPKSFGLDLGDLSNDTWSLLPSADDFLAEVRTTRFETLSYAKSSGEVENISLFDRKAHRNLAVYSSPANIERYSRFYDEDALSDIAVREYDIDVAFSPDRAWIAGRARLTVEVKSNGLNTLTMRLAEPLNIESVLSLEYGRLLTIRVRNQNTVVVNLPATLVRGSRLTMVVNYSGSAPPQMVDRESLDLLGQVPQVPQEGDVPLVDSYLYSTRSYWYPQPTTTGFSTGRIAITVPASYSAVASGELQGVEPRATPRGPAARRFTFKVAQPARYFAFLVTPLVDGKSETLHLSTVIEKVRESRPAGVFYDSVDLRVKTNPRLQARGRDVARISADVLKHYASILGDVPYPEMTIAVVEKPAPGGHSPAYMAVIGSTVAGASVTYREDPASFPEFPEFFVAHEIAHQWWGQAVGWKNYHEQWLSEGFAQYFAALYAQKARGKGVFDSMMRRMRRWAVDKSAEGPIYLGYRVGHVKGDSRLFRAVVYNKSAVVLDMLRTLMGDEAFFRGVRQFYTAFRFKKAGTEDLRQAMESASGQSLSRFFDRWVHSDALPALNFTVKIEPPAAGAAGAGEAVLRFEQPGEIFDFPLTVVVDYLDKPAATLHLKMTDRVLETRVPLAGTVRRIDIDRDRTTVGIIKEALITQLRVP